MDPCRPYPGHVWIWQVRWSNSSGTGQCEVINVTVVIISFLWLRSMLASIVTAMELLCIMQDEEFPRFSAVHRVRLVGLHASRIAIMLKNCTVVITGKWFNYSLVLFTMIVNLIMFHYQVRWQKKALLFGLGHPLPLGVWSFLLIIHLVFSLRTIPNFTIKQWTKMVWSSIQEAFWTKPRQ